MNVTRHTTHDRQCQKQFHARSINRAPYSCDCTICGVDGKRGNIIGPVMNGVRVPNGHPWAGRQKWKPHMAIFERVLITLAHESETCICWWCEKPSENRPYVSNLTWEIQNMENSKTSDITSNIIVDQLLSICWGHNVHNLNKRLDYLESTP